MEWKFLLAFLLVFWLVVGFILVVGLNAKDRLNNQIGEVNNLDDVKEFLEKCKAKPFLDCESLLLRAINSASSNDKANLGGEDGEL